MQDHARERGGEVHLEVAGGVPGEGADPVSLAEREPGQGDGQPASGRGSLLQAAAVIGEQFTFTLLHAIAEEEFDELAAGGKGTVERHHRRPAASLRLGPATAPAPGSGHRPATCRRAPGNPGVGSVSFSTLTGAKRTQ